MATTYTWSIPKNGLKVQTVDGRENTVTSVNFNISATDGTKTVDLNSTVKVPLDASAGFVPFAQLTEAKVLEWVKNNLGNKTIEAFEKVLNKKLTNKTNPPVQAVAVKAPWA